MNPIEELQAEHRGIENALDILETIAELLVMGENSGVVRDAEALIGFFRTFVDTCHHSKEENGLFPALEQAGVSQEDSPVKALLNEHEQGRSHIREMARALKDYQAGKPKAAERFSQHADGYIDLLHQHIEKEDQVLFPMAVDRLSPDISSQLEETFAKIESEVVGEGKHEQYHTMLDAFMEKYGLEAE
jgi:hemerythrin-like domain-containing protein